MRTGAALLLAALALPAAPARAADADDGVVVIRGSEVSVARPLETQLVLDGSARVEIVRVEPAPRAPAPREPERETVVIAVPVPMPTSEVGIPLGWGQGWLWKRPHRHGRHHGFGPLVPSRHHGTGPLVPSYHPLRIQPAAGRRNLHGR